MVLKTLSYLLESKFSKRFPKFKNKVESLEDRYCQWREYAGPRGFEESVITVRGSFGEAQLLKVSDYIHRFSIEHNSTNPSKEQIVEYILAEGKSERVSHLVIDTSLGAGGVGLKLSDEVKPQNIFSGQVHYAKLEIKGSQDFLIIKGAHIRNLYMEHPVKHMVSINNCCINEIYFPRGKDDQNGEGRMPWVEINDSWIGRLNLNPQSVHDFRISDSWICSVNCPPPDQPNPFVGSVKFHKVKMPTSDRSRVYRETGTQQFRNLRAHFEKLQNGPMAGQMRAKELVSERETDSGVSWFFNWVYCIASGYGRKPGWAFIWSLVFLVLNIMILTGADGVRVDSLNLSQGAWQLEWQGDDFRSQFGRASILTFQTVINPFTIFVAKSTFKFKFLCGLIHTFFFVILADAAFVFGSLAIRKRLKFS